VLSALYIYAIEVVDCSVYAILLHISRTWMGPSS